MAQTEKFTIEKLVYHRSIEDEHFDRRFLYYLLSKLDLMHMPRTEVALHVHKMIAHLCKFI